MNQGFMVRYFLQTDIFDTLQKSGNEIVILTTDVENPELQSCRRFANVTLEEYNEKAYEDYLKHSRLEKWLKQVRHGVMNARGEIPITTCDDIYRSLVWDNKAFYSSGFGRIVYFVLNTSVQILRRSRLLRWLLLLLEHAFFTPDVHRYLFEKYRPHALVVASMGTFDYDQYIMREARRHKVKVISVVLSWDNTTCRGYVGAVPDRVIAWTEEMRRELIQLQDIPNSKIDVGGVAHFDHYYREDTFLSRTQFCSLLGLNPQRRILFFATKSPNTYPFNYDIAEMIARALHENRIVGGEEQVQLLVRLHPIYFKAGRQGYLFSDFLKQFEDLEKTYPQVVVNRPVISSKSMNFLMPPEEIRLLASMLKHSEVLINCFSTLNLEASIFDLPAVNVSFEGTSYSKKKKGRYDVAMDERQTHNQRVVQTGGVTMVYSEKELIDGINEALTDPAKRRDQRSLIRANECGPYPGEAGRRIAALILAQ